MAEFIFDIEETLPRLQLFRNVSFESISVYLEAVEWMDLPAGTVLIDPNKENHSLYCLLSGKLRVHLESPEKTAFTVLEPGECAGEMSLIDHKSPSAYVVAAENCRLMVIGQDLLWAMINVSHGIARNLLYILSGRLRYDHAFISHTLERQEKFEKFAMIDSLTGLHNRRWLDNMFEREIRRCDMDHSPLAMAMIDIDHFKAINDAFGHPAGDQALVSICSLLRSHLRPNEMLARYGGEEFALLLPQTDLSEALHIAGRLCRAVDEMDLGMFAEKRLPGLTVSIGVAEMKPGDDLKALITRTDEALYRAKKAGRNRVAQ